MRLMIVALVIGMPVMLAVSCSKPQTDPGKDSNRTATAALWLARRFFAADEFIAGITNALEEANP